MNRTNNSPLQQTPAAETTTRAERWRAEKLARKAGRRAA
jgi:hypothetical protein